MTFVSQLPLTQHLAKHQLILLAASAQRIKLRPNTLVVKQGDQPDYLYFIKTGLVKVARKVCFLPQKYYYKDGDQRLNPEQIKEAVKIDPNELNYKPTFLTEQDFVADYTGKQLAFQISWSEIDTKTIDLFTLGSFQCFGFPFSVRNEDHIEIYSGQVYS